MATASAPFQHPADIQNPNQVKVVSDHKGHALYFSRAIIPYDRDRLALGEGTPAPDLYRKHLGIYAYTRDALLTLSTTPLCDLERLEKLERQRARRQAAGMAFTGAMATAEVAGAEAARHTPFVRDTPKVKPNEPCYCGSGRKFKKCHGAGM